MKAESKRHQASSSCYRNQYCNRNDNEKGNMEQLKNSMNRSQ